MINYYELLGVLPTASLEEIKESYTVLLKQYHPDVFNGNKEYAQQTTSQINEAYSVLKDEEQRKQYDINNNFALGKNTYKQKPTKEKVVIKDEKINKEKKVCLKKQKEEINSEDLSFDEQQKLEKKHLNFTFLFLLCILGILVILFIVV